MKNIIKFIFGAVLIIAFMWVTNIENELVHDHVTVSYAFAGGNKTYTITYCNTERVQVVFGKDHRETYNSIKYFNTEQ